MSKFYVIILSRNDIYDGKGFYYIKIETRKTMSLLPKESGKVLVYTEVNDDASQTHYIKESLFQLLPKEYKFNIVDIIDEADIPKECSKDFSL